MCVCKNVNITHAKEKAWKIREKRGLNYGGCKSCHTAAMLAPAKRPYAAGYYGHTHRPKYSLEGSTFCGIKIVQRTFQMLGSWDLFQKCS